MGDSWAGAARRRVSDPRAQNVTNRGEDKMEGSWRRDDSRFKDDIAEEPVADWEQAADSEAPPTDSSTSKDTVGSVSRPDSARQSTPNTDPSIPIDSHLPNGVSALPSASDSYNPEAVSWCYKDPTGQVQGTLPLVSGLTYGAEKFLQRQVLSLLQQCKAGTSGITLRTIYS